MRAQSGLPMGTGLPWSHLGPDCVGTTVDRESHRPALPPQAPFVVAGGGGFSTCPTGQAWSHLHAFAQAADSLLHDAPSQLSPASLPLLKPSSISRHSKSSSDCPSTPPLPSILGSLFPSSSLKASPGQELGLLLYS